MAKSTGRKAALFYGAVGSATSFVKIPQLTSIGKIESTSSDIDATDLESTAKEYLAGLGDYSAVPMSGQWDPSNVVHQFLKTDQAAGTIRYWRILIYRGAVLIRTQTFLAKISTFSTGPLENETVVGMEFTLRISGAVTEV